MDDQTSLEQGLQALRLAAERGDWNGWRDATEALLLRLPTNHSVRLVRDFIARQLPTFECHQPDVHWPRELLAVLSEENSASSERQWPFGDDFPGPGSASFANAVESLWRARLSTEDARQCTTELVDALSDAVMAEAIEPWGARHPEEWALWYQLARSEENDRHMFELQRAIMSAPDVMSRKRAGWLEVADRLEAAIRERAGSSGGPEHPGR